MKRCLKCSGESLEILRRVRKPPRHCP
jgi:hypothetical protein